MLLTMVELFEKKSMVWGGFKKNLSIKPQIKPLKSIFFFKYPIIIIHF